MAVNIETILKKELEEIIFQSLLKKYQDQSDEKLRTIATMLSWIIYGASIDWKRNSNRSREDYLEYASLSIRQFLSME
ncbi:hypothetical protein PH210_06505 [Paenibacillus sp. BSR1-1]|uniref:hypothetical protein n=1 Tax=Paenibacillus sp. BSR1-1 TaxID=3020845 RepID=UPI0025B0365E|nr:hypothetical protein [Paenibacillus sp. BSR1-1]MDN3015858.1 hypothetical protein [Paenibacillus sp. BSR1-1]